MRADQWEIFPPFPAEEAPGAGREKIGLIRAVLETDLQLAMARKELNFHYQPIVSLQQFDLLMHFQ